jgi:hypothetical protein
MGKTESARGRKLIGDLCWRKNRGKENILRHSMARGMAIWPESEDGDDDDSDVDVTSEEDRNSARNEARLAQLMPSVRDQDEETDGEGSLKIGVTVDDSAWLEWI